MRIFSLSLAIALIASACAAEKKQPKLNFDASKGVEGSVMMPQGDDGEIRRLH